MWVMCMCAALTHLCLALLRSSPCRRTQGLQAAERVQAGPLPLELHLHN